MEIKKAKYVSKNIEINQEFHFTAPETKLKVNEIYNQSWYGSVLWDLFSPAAVKLESSYNRSVKIMLDIPYANHRGLIEPLTRRRHLKKILLRRFLQFIEAIKRSKKKLLRTILILILVTIERDVLSPTGKNLRNILLTLGLTDISDLTVDNIDEIDYFPLDEDETWRIEMLEGLLQERVHSILAWMIIIRNGWNFYARNNLLG